MEGAQKAASDEVIQGKDGVKGKFLNPTPMLDELEKGPWPSFISGFKELAERTETVSYTHLTLPTILRV